MKEFLLHCGFICIVILTGLIVGLGYLLLIGRIDIITFLVG